MMKPTASGKARRESDGTAQQQPRRCWRRSLWVLTLLSLGLSGLASWTVAQQPGQVEPARLQPNPVVPKVPTSTPPTQPPASGQTTAPAPRSDGMSGRIRLPFLPKTPNQLGAPPRPTREKLEEAKQFVPRIIDPEFTLDVIVGQPRLLILTQTPKKYQIGNEAIASVDFPSDKELSILGRDVGTTVLNLWFTDPNNPNEQRIISYLVRVIPDPNARARLEAIYKALEDEINRAFPDSWVCLALVGDKLVVSGQAKDVAEMYAILRIIRSNAPATDSARLPVDNVNLNLSAADLEALDGMVSPTVRDFLTAGGPNVVNLMRVPGEQNVNLRITVAEVNRAAARSIGMNFGITNRNGVQVFANTTGGLLANTPGLGTGGTGTSGGGATGQGSNSGLGGAFGQLTGTGGVAGAANLPVNLDNGQVALAINALRSLSYARTLAEPNLTTLNGQPASFLAGGQFPVPVVTGATATGLQGVTFVPFGVQMTFTPYITDRDRIRLQINAAVSARDQQAGNSVIGGTAVPNLSTRNFTTTVELREGQTFAVAGLIQNNLGSNSDRVPLLGDLPIIGRLWSFDRISAGEQELVILVTPELVHPLEPKEIPPLPGSDLFEPGDLEFYVWGRLESRRSYDYRSTVMNDLDRMCRYRHCENLYILGPHGHVDVPRPADNKPMPPPPPAKGKDDADLPMPTPTPKPPR